MSGQIELVKKTRSHVGNEGIIGYNVSPEALQEGAEGDGLRV